MSFAAMCQHPAVLGVVLRSMVKEAKKGKLANSEVPSAIYIEPEPWLPDSGLVTPTLKLKRPKLREHYTHAISRLYGNDDLSPGDRVIPSEISQVCALMCVGVYV